MEVNCSLFPEKGKAQCYDPDLNRWSTAPWTKATSNLEVAEDHCLRAVLLVNNEICFVLEMVEGYSTWLGRYVFDTGSFLPPIYWQDKRHVCAVAVDSYMYAIGGRNHTGVSSQCARFDARQNKWQGMANLQEARRLAFGVGTKENIFIAGGLGVKGDYDDLRTCEVYSIQTEEWYFISNLTIPRRMGSMVLVGERLHVLCGLNPLNLEDEWTVECYDDKRDEWKIKTCIPNKTTFMRRNCFNACSLTLFKGCLNNLESVNSDHKF